VRHWRKMTWVLWIWSILILVWAIAGGSSASDDCIGNARDQLTKDACNTGAGIGVAIILLIGFFGFVFFSLIWFMTRPREKAQVAAGQQPSAGWYNDAEHPGQERYWDGVQWTDHRRVAGSEIPQPPPA
jgi:hypothetical protein